MLRPNPYLRAAIRSVRNRARAEGPLVVAAQLAVPLAAAAMLVPLVRPTLFAFLDRPGQLDEGLAQITLRAALVVVGALAIDVYEGLIRGHGRQVVSLLPADPSGVSIAEVLRIAAARWWLLPTAAIVLSPIAAEGHVRHYAAALVVVAGCVVLGLWASAAAHLLAIGLAESPAAAPILDLVRGNNPRASAAFLYAPGALVVVCSAVLWQASSSVPAAAAGDPVALLSLLAPVGAALVAGAGVPYLARRTWFRGTVVLSEIDARDALIADPRDAGRVYLDWTTRWLPASWRVYALDDLRHGWRSRRTLVTGSWLLGLLAAAAGWTDPAAGPTRAAGVAIGAAFLVAANGVFLAADEPAYLRVWLPPRLVRAMAARGAVLAMWAAPPIGLGAAAVAARAGLGAGLGVLGTGVIGVACALGLSLACGRLRERGIAAYAPTAAVLSAALMLGLTR